jgi:hypothetical protein
MFVSLALLRLQRTYTASNEGERTFLRGTAGGPAAVVTRAEWLTPLD